MKALANPVVIVVCSLTLLVSCQKINLNGGGKGGSAPAQHQQSGGGKPNQSANTGGSGSLFGGGQAAQNAPPPLDGEWEVDYEFKGNPYIGNVTLAQAGNVLTGTGADQDGREWQVDNGQVQGTKVAFGKKYANSSSPPITYTGELKFLQSPEYTGWAMEGTYSSASPDGAPIKGKWVANPTGQLGGAPPQDASAPPPEQQQPAGTSFFGGNTAPPSPRNSAPEHIGDARPTDITGHYDGSYNYNFKKVTSKMWIESDGKKVSGHGYDVLGPAPAAAKPKSKGKGKEKEKPRETQDNKDNFVIEKGWYVYPNVTLVRQYTKGKGAKETRTVTFRAQLSSNGRDIVMKGETQFGGSWDAHRL